MEPLIPPPIFPELTVLCLLLGAFALLAASYSDLRWRRIPNALCLFMALLALPYWIGRAGPRPEALLAPLAFCVAALLVLVPLWLARMIGGGDVKLLASLMLWQDGNRLDVMLAAMMLTGGLAGLAVWGIDAVRADGRRFAVPYGVAITAGAFVAHFPLLQRLLALLD